MKVKIFKISLIYLKFATFQEPEKLVHKPEKIISMISSSFTSFNCNKDPHFIPKSFDNYYDTAK